MKTSVKNGSWLKILLLFIVMIGVFNMRKTEVDNEDFIKTSSTVILPSVPKVIKVNETVKVNNDEIGTVVISDNVVKTYFGNISHYGADCVGCSGVTADGINISDGNIYYNDKDYGLVRIVAADSSMPFGTIISISSNDNNILAIVLDRGMIGFSHKYMFDLLVESEEISYQLGVMYNAKIDVLRYGY